MQQWDSMEPEPWELDEIELEDLSDPDGDEDYDEEPSSYSSDERFGSARQADRELDRAMHKYVKAAALRVPWERALCHAERIKKQGIHPDTWFAGDEDVLPGDTRPFTRAQVREKREYAASICWQCPIRVKCLEAACVASEPAGIWGGLGPDFRCNTNDPHHNMDFLLQITENPYAEYEEGDEAA